MDNNCVPPRKYKRNNNTNTRVTIKAKKLKDEFKSNDYSDNKDNNVNNVSNNKNKKNL